MRPQPLLVVLGVSLVLAPRPAAAADKSDAKDDVMTDEEVVIKSEGGTHRLQLPKDWPVEETPGLIRPAPIETYLSMKFRQVRDVVTSLDSRLDALEERLARLEADQKTVEKRLQLLEERAKQQEEDSHGHKAQER